MSFNTQAFESGSLVAIRGTTVFGISVLASFFSPKVFKRMNDPCTLQSSYLIFHIQPQHKVENNQTSSKAHRENSTCSNPHLSVSCCLPGCHSFSHRCFKTQFKCFSEEFKCLECRAGEVQFVCLWRKCCPRLFFYSGKKKKLTAHLVSITTDNHSSSPVALLSVLFCVF